jgi:O-antigen/teichoic acid export membrane protein
MVIAGLIYTGLISLALPCKVYQAALRGYGRVDHEQALETGATLVRLAATVAALSAGFKLIAVALCNGGTSLMAGLLAYPLAARAGGDLRPLPLRFSFQLMRTLTRPSLAFLALQAGATLTLGIDNLVIGATLGGAAVTRYAVPFRLIWMASLAFTVAVNAALPAITGHYALARRAELARHYLTAMRCAILFATCGTLILWTTGPSLIRLWAGAGVFPGGRVFAMQLILFAILITTAPAAAILNATTNHYRYAAITIVEGLLNFGLSLLGVRHYGLAGVIGGTIVAALLTTAWYVSLAAPALLGLMRRDLLSQLALPAAASLAALGLNAVSGRHARAGTAIASAVAIATGLAAVNIRLILTPDERRLIGRLLRGALSVPWPQARGAA